MLLCAVVVLGVVLGVAPALAASEAISVPVQLESGQRQLMIDEFLLDDASSTNSADGAAAPVLRMHPAQKTGQLVIVADKPWEGVIFYYDSVVQVSDNEFRIYYECVVSNTQSLHELRSDAPRPFVD
eukprot:COSAG02_NODE_3233_length_7129_cov_27.245946_2_plen_127_part_00